jgi:hypothetical protein
MNKKKNSEIKHEMGLKTKETKQKSPKDKSFRVLFFVGKLLFNETKLINKIRRMKKSLTFILVA